MIGPEHMAVVVEIGLGPGRLIDGAEDNTHCAGIDPVEIDHGLHQLAQLAGRDRRGLARREAQAADAVAEHAAQRPAQAMARTTPPSTRRAAPLVAAARALQT